MCCCICRTSDRILQIIYFPFFCRSSMDTVHDIRNLFTLILYNFFQEDFTMKTLQDYIDKLNALNLIN